MQLKEGAHVVTPDGKDVGIVRRVVIDPRSMHITSLVVQEGLLNPTEKVVPVTLVDSSSDKEIRLKEIEGGYDNLLDFMETEYRVVDENDLLKSSDAGASGAQTLFPYPPAVPVTGSTQMMPGTLPQPGIPEPDVERGYTKEERRNIPADQIALKEGAEVLSADGAKLGKIERVLSQPVNDKITHFVVEKGLFFKEHKLVPVEWVDHIFENEVHLGVNARFMESLPDYKEH